MRVLVGTMEHGEGEFDECRSAIARQQDADFTHLVISSLPEKEAHERLYSQWNAVKSGFDLFLKVDGDTVLAHRHVIKAYVDMFEANPRLTGVQAWLFDHMTNDNIYGLTCLRNNVDVAVVVDPLYCDRADTGHDIVMRGDQLPRELVPAGFHCKSPTEEQAFHYGFHRGKKNQHDVRAKVLNAFLAERDKGRGMALLGFYMGSKASTTNYDTQEFQMRFGEAIMDYDKLIKKVIR